jgi:hypothetical protein
MNHFLPLVKDLLRSPIFYAHFVLASGGIVATHFNQGATGNWRLGLISIATSLLGVALFYWQLYHLRRGRGLPQNRNGFRLFFSIYLFRIRLFIVLSPVILPLLFWSRSVGLFDAFTQAYLSLAVAAGAEKIGALGTMLKLTWPWVLLFIFALVLDQAGRSLVVAFESSKKAIRGLAANTWYLKKEILALVAIELVFVALNSTDSLFDPLDSAYAWVGTAIRLATAPLQFGLELVATVYMAMRLNFREAKS